MMNSYDTRAVETAPYGEAADMAGKRLDCFNSVPCEKGGFKTMERLC